MDAATGCLQVTHLAVKADLGRRPDLSGRLLLIASGGSGRRDVVDASPEAQSAGARLGQTLTLALSYCRDAVVLPLDRQYLNEIHETVLDVLLGVVDRVEIGGCGRFDIDLRGLAPMYGGEDGLATAILAAINPVWRPRLGLAGGKFPAYCAAARADAGGFFRAPDDTARWLAPWPLSWLPLAGNQIARLRSFGVTTLGNVAALTPEQLTDFLGPQGRRVWQLARGIDDDPVIPAQRPDALREALEFPFLVDTVSGWEAGVRELATRVWNRRERQGRGIGRVMLEGRLLGGHGWQFSREFREPAHSAQRLGDVTLAALNAQDTRGRGRWPEQPLVDLTLTASGLTRLLGRQMVLPADTRPQREIPDVAGVSRAVALTPDSPLPERRWGLGSELRPLGSVTPAWVLVRGELPQSVDGQPVQRIVDLWEVDTDWWTPEPARRRYWQALLAGGALVTVYWDLISGDWRRQVG